MRCASARDALYLGLCPLCLSLCRSPRARRDALSLGLCSALRVRTRRSCNAICIGLRICGDLLCPRCRVLDESCCLVAGSTGRCGGCA